MPFDESHVDDDVLALLALGEPAGSTSDLAHIEECERCTDELDSLRDVVGLARVGAAEGPLVAPAPQVWDRIADELGLESATARRPPPSCPSTPAVGARARGAGSPAPRPRAWWSAGAAPGGWPTAPTR